MTVTLMDKAEKAFWLPLLFDLLYDNMKDIAPSGAPYEVERGEFISNVSAALEKAPRQILLAAQGHVPVGYIQYYTRGELLMVEEVQIRKDYQNTLLFLRLCRELLKRLPAEIRVVEAYADPRNAESLGLMARLGMEKLADSGEFVHLRGDAVAIRKRFTGILPLETE